MTCLVSPGDEMVFLMTGVSRRRLTSHSSQRPTHLPEAWNMTVLNSLEGFSKASCFMTPTRSLPSMLRRRLRKADFLAFLWPTMKTARVFS